MVKRKKYNIDDDAKNRALCKENGDVRLKKNRNQKKTSVFFS